MRRIATIIAPVAVAATTVTLSAYAAATPLPHTLLTAGAIPGYTPAAPAAKTLDLVGYANKVGLDPTARKKLAASGFVAAAVENLHGPAPIPAGAGSSQSSAVQFSTNAKARSFFNWVNRTYGGEAPKGLHLAVLPIPSVPVAHGTHYWGTSPNGRIDEYDARFVRGPVMYELDIFTRDQTLSPASFEQALNRYFQHL
jgi:hypothetical protein